MGSSIHMSCFILFPIKSGFSNIYDVFSFQFSTLSDSISTVTQVAAATAVSSSSTAVIVAVVCCCCFSRKRRDKSKKTPSSSSSSSGCQGHSLDVNDNESCKVKHLETDAHHPHHHHHQHVQMFHQKCPVPDHQSSSHRPSMR